MKKLGIGLLVSMICLASSTMSFANEEPKTYQDTVNLQANNVEEITGISEINNKFIVEPEAYTMIGEDANISIPKNASDEVILDGKETAPIRMELPLEEKNTKGIMTKNGTIIYCAPNSDIDVSVQALTENDNGVLSDAVRNMIVIKNQSAPKEYSFNFKLQKGWRLIRSEEYADLYSPDDKSWIGAGLIFIINKDGDILSTIDSPWAKDANNKTVKTYYKLEGNTLKQVVEFDQNTAFPLILDPTQHAPKYRYRTMTFKNSAKTRKHLIELRREINRRQNSTVTKVVKYVNHAFSLLSETTGITESISVITNGADSYLEYMEDMYTEIHEDFSEGKKKSAKITYKIMGTWQGNNRGYVYRTLKRPTYK